MANRWYVYTFDSTNLPRDIQPVINKLISFELPRSTSYKSLNSLRVFCLHYFLLRHRNDERILSFTFLEVFLSSDAEAYVVSFIFSVSLAIFLLFFRSPLNSVLSSIPLNSEVQSYY